ncbi:DUF4314 domain-containing protein [Arcanobacterium hippocoleae]|uniref:DUF4314 domain-containing protein n=1 Tax=Arcanobacterium hippocoleae TaxID=149017 RepID=UPI00333F6B49
MNKPTSRAASALTHKKDASLIGRRVELVSLNDPYSRLRPGEQGTVKYIDDMGTVFIRWDSGSGLGLIPGVDEWAYL